MAAARGFVEAIRRIPSALRRPETLILAMAIFASLGVHMPPYMGLGALAEYWKKQEAKRKAEQPATEVSFEISDAPQPLPEPEPVEDAPEPSKPSEPEKQPDSKKVAETKVPPKPKPKPTKPEPEPEKVSEVQVKPPEQTKQRRQSITQKSEEDVEPPPDARFLAEKSRRVKEETVAMVRDEMRDDAKPEAAAPEDRGVDQAGDDKEDTHGYHEQGEEKGEKLAEEPKPEPRPQKPEKPAPAEQAEPGQRAQDAQEAVAERPASESSPVKPGTVIQDPLGSFTLATAEEPRERQQGQAARARQEGRSGRTGQAGGEGRPTLGVSWRVFEDTYDAETLARERTPKRRKRSGSSERKKRWKEFRAAIENYVVGVRPGNQTALNAAADPFAAYIASFHRHLHMEFAHRFLAGLPATGEMADPNLVTKVEIVVNSDGTLHRVGVVSSSGQMMFDFGAFNAVKSGEPYPQPPARIRSADGRVYLRWALHRNLSQCGTWNAEPYILKDPPDMVEDGVPGPPGMQLGPRRRQGPG